jgi:uncharacterized protein (TIGR03083 family)
MDVAALTDQLDQEGKAMTEAAGESGLTSDVPNCPGWNIRDLLGHVGKVHRWATEHVRRGRAAFDGGTAKMAKPPKDDLLDWFVDGYEGLVVALRAAPSDLDCWSFLPAPSPLAFWARRQAHETAIHRADAESARGEVPTYPAAFATDGLGELLEGFFGRKRGKLLADPAVTLRVAPDDADRSWHVRIGPESRTITVDGDDTAQCTVRGRASDVYLSMWNRTPAAAVAVDGDESVLDLWSELARVSWS